VRSTDTTKQKRPVVVVVQTDHYLLHATAVEMMIRPIVGADLAMGTETEDLPVGTESERKEDMIAAITMSVAEGGMPTGDDLGLLGAPQAHHAYLVLPARATPL
jgi:hypothetical protein